MATSRLPGQAEAIEQLRDLERTSAAAIELLTLAESPRRNGSLEVEVSIACDGFERREGGLPLRDREVFTIILPGDFPFEVPILRTRHTRFADFEHVQWKRQICLYISIETEWDPSDGMFGFMERLVEWLKLGARNEFEPAGVPLHPPIAYPSVSAGLVVPRANCPPIGQDPWLGYMAVHEIGRSRADVVAWFDNVPNELDRFAEKQIIRSQESGVDVDADGTTQGVQESSLSKCVIGVAILLPSTMPFEFPSKVSDLIRQLVDRGVSQRLLLLHLMLGSINNDIDTALYFAIGTPSRGISGDTFRAQHLTFWKLEPLVANALRVCIRQFSDDEERKRIGEDMELALLRWAEDAELTWAAVREARPEVTTRRDTGTPASIFSGRAVAVWGCGALGAHVAECLARAGVRKLVLRDHGIVAPGILVRQPFFDSEIGEEKATTVANRIRSIDPRIDVSAHTDSILIDPLSDEEWSDDVDIIIDATASARVLEKLERRRQEPATRRVAIVSMAVDFRAQHGIVTFVAARHSGGPADTIRRTKLAVCRNPELKRFTDAFWTKSNRNPIFQPEPGCSENTFIGSAADISALAATMLNCAGHDFRCDLDSGATEFSATSHLVAQLDGSGVGSRHARFEWLQDIVSHDPQTGFEIRTSRDAWSEIEGWIANARRLLGQDVETGGVLFGERNDATRVLWVDEVIGPPPDSWSAPQGFVCGIEGVNAANSEKSVRSRGSVAFVGMWHTHPESNPLPSDTDLLGMARITAAADSSTPKALLLIVGLTTSAVPVFGTYLFNRKEFAASGLLPAEIVSDTVSERTQIDVRNRLRFRRDERERFLRTSTLVQYNRLCEVRRSPQKKSPSRVGLALSGGGSRAIAFHLGCLRALHDRGVLDQVRILSTVSGGSVLGAMYAYGEYPDFASFENEVQSLLRNGLASRLALRLFSPRAILGSVITTVTAGVAALGADVVRSIANVSGLGTILQSEAISNIQPPIHRWESRSTAFESVLSDALFGNRRMNEVRRTDLEVVINTTELRSGTAFRFGSLITGGSRFGQLKSSEQSVALAVAASAAYPAILPAFDRTFSFTKKDGTTSLERVLLSDGGVYDNLGTLCLEPVRVDESRPHRADLDYLIACDAGVGVIDGNEIPYWWGTRMTAAFETTFRRVQNSSRNRLHSIAASGQLKGFVLAYLGQNDRRLPWAPPDLVPRASVVKYATNFSAMTEENIERLSKRGEQLTRLLIAHYMPSI